MELRHLRYFVAVAEHENVSRAALRLHVSQPALSRQIRDLEDELGFPLLERSAKSVRLTEAGRVFLSEAKAVLARVQEGVDKARAHAGETTGELRVGYAPSPTVQILPRALRRFKARLPRFKVILHDLSAEEMLSQLHSGKLDLALTVQPSPKAMRGLRFVEAARYPICVAVAPGHRLARSRAIKLEALVSEPLLGYSRKEYPDYFDMIETLFRPIGHEPKFAEEHDSVNSIITGVEAGHGVAVLPKSVECMTGSRLRLIPLQPAGSPIVVGALVGKQTSTAVEEFIQATMHHPP